MSDDIIIKIGSQISPSIKKDLKDIGDSASNANLMVENLRKNMSNLNVASVIAKSAKSLANLSVETDKAVISKNKLEASEERLLQSYHASYAAENREAKSLQILNEATNKSSISKNKLADSEEKLIQTFHASYEAERREAESLQMVRDGTDRVSIAKKKLLTIDEKHLQLKQKREIVERREAEYLRMIEDGTDRVSVAKAKKLRLEERDAQLKLKTAALIRNEEQALRMLADGTDRASMAKRRLEASTSRAAAAIERQNGTLRKSILQFASLTRAVRTLAIFYGAREFIQAVDTFTNLGNRLALVTTNAGQAATIQKELFRIANDSRTSIDDVAKSYQRFDLALVQLGASQQESLRFTETLTKTLAISGVSTNEASQGLLQFSQALNKGKLDGDEFRTVMETIPILSQAIADELGVARGELLKLAPTGVITTDVLRNAIRSMEEDVDRRMSGLSTTIGQSFVIMGNKMTEAMGALQKEASIFADVIVFLANNLANLAKIAGIAIASFTAYKVALFFAVDATKSLSAASIALTAIMEINPFVLAATAIIAAVSALTLYRDEIKLTEDGMTTLGDVMRGVWETTKTLWYGFSSLAVESVTVVYNTYKPFFDFIWGGYKFLFNSVAQATLSNIAVFKGMLSAIKAMFKDFPKTFANFFIDGANFALTAVKNLIINMSKLFAKIPGFGGTELNMKILNKYIGAGIPLYKEEGTNAAQAFAEAYSKTMADGFSFNNIFGDFDDSFLGVILDDIAANIKKSSEERRKLEEQADSELRKEKEINRTLKEREDLLKAFNAAKTRGDAVFAFESALKGDVSGKSLDRAEADTLQVKLAEEERLYQERLLFLQGFEENKMVLIEGVNDAELTLFQTKQEALTALEAQHTAQREQLVIDSDARIAKAKSDKRKMELSQTADLLGSLSDLFGQFDKSQKKRDKAAFLASQTFALAQAGINVALGISEALKKDPPSSYLLAAQTAVAGGIAIGKIAGATLSYKDGGLITGPGGPRSDSVPINASNGEFIVNAEATSRNKALLNAINSGRSFDTGSNNGYSTANFGLQNASSTSGNGLSAGKNVVVNVYNEDGVKAEVQTTENSQEIQIDLFVKKVDDKLAQNLHQNTGALTAALNQRRKRGF